jgi:hypothetical protein
MANEALAKILCHNLCVVIGSMYELGINPVFWGTDEVAESEPQTTEPTTDELMEMYDWV